MGQDICIVFFGLGEFILVDFIVVYWLSGYIDQYYNLNINICLVLCEGGSIDGNILFDL